MVKWEQLLTKTGELGMFFPLQQACNFRLHSWKLALVADPTLRMHAGCLDLIIPMALRKSLWLIVSYVFHVKDSPAVIEFSCQNQWSRLHVV